MKPLPRFKRASADAVADLCSRSRNGDTVARNLLVNANMRLVAKIATRCVRAAGRMDLLDDCIQEAVAGASGRSGLLRAIELFDPSRRQAFSTFAAFWIRDAVMGVLKSQHVAASRHVAARRTRIRRAADAVEMRIGRAPTPTEVRAELVATGCKHPSSLRLETIERALSSTMLEISFEEIQRNAEEHGHHERDALVDHTAPSEDAMIEAIDAQRRAETLRAALQKLEPAHREALAKRFGFGRHSGRGGSPPTTLEAAAMQRLREVLTGAPTQ